MKRRKRHIQTQQVHLHNMSRNVVRVFKAYCTERGVHMNQAVEYLMRQCLKNKGKVAKEQIQPYRRNKKGE